jgi:superfamily II DNA helicase RecQ
MPVTPRTVTLNAATRNRTPSAMCATATYTPVQRTHYATYALCNVRTMQAAITGLSSGEVKVLVATDIAARGLDLPMVQLVIQYDLAPDVTSYLHRAGRTGRWRDFARIVVLRIVMTLF